MTSSLGMKPNCADVVIVVDVAGPNVFVQLRADNGGTSARRAARGESACMVVSPRGPRCKRSAAPAPEGRGGTRDAAAIGAMFTVESATIETTQPPPADPEHGPGIPKPVPKP